MILHLLSVTVSILQRLPLLIFTTHFKNTCPQSKHIPNHCIVHFKYIPFYLLFISNKAGKKRGGCAQRSHPRRKKKKPWKELKMLLPVPAPPLTPWHIPCPLWPAAPLWSPEMISNPPPQHLPDSSAPWPPSSFQGACHWPLFPHFQLCQTQVLMGSKVLMACG